jgi:hypothetical protein
MAVASGHRSHIVGVIHDLIRIAAYKIVFRRCRLVGRVSDRAAFRSVLEDERAAIYGEVEIDEPRSIATYGGIHAWRTSWPGTSARRYPGAICVGGSWVARLRVDRMSRTAVARAAVGRIRADGGSGHAAAPIMVPRSPVIASDARDEQVW